MFDPLAQHLAQRGYAVLLPNIRGSSGYGKPFEDLNNGDWGHGDLKDAIAGADWLRAQDWIDGAHIGITGTSYGGCLSMSAVCNAPGQFQAAAPHAGYAMFLGGGPRVVVLRESLFSGVLGLTCFVSLLFPRPLMFFVGRSLIAGNDPAHIARYNQLWQNSSVRHTTRVCTVVWGAVYSGELLLKVLLVATLPLAAVVAIGPLLTGGLIGAALLWTFAYLGRARQQVRALQPNTPREAEAAPSDGDRQSATAAR